MYTVPSCNADFRGHSESMIFNWPVIGPICQREHFKSCMAASRTVAIYVLSRKNRCLVRGCLFCTLPTYTTKSTNMESTFTRTPTIHS